MLYIKGQDVLLWDATCMNAVGSLPSDQIALLRSIPDRHSGSTASVAREGSIGWYTTVRLVFLT